MTTLLDITNNDVKKVWVNNSLDRQRVDNDNDNVFLGLVKKLIYCLFKCTEYIRHHLGIASAGMGR